MLCNLHIQNYAILDELDVNFDQGFNIITGETGAGKSILLGALSLILGKRADSKALRNKAKKCIVEGTFKIDKSTFTGFFLQHDLDLEEDEIVIRREISLAGKSRAFVNDTPVRLDVLHALTKQLIDLHQQFETLDIQSTSAQYAALDAYCGNTNLIKDYNTYFNQLKSLRLVIQEKEKRYQQAIQEQDYLRFQIEEFEKLDIRKGETGTLEEEFRLLSQSEDIAQSLAETLSALADTEGNIIDRLRILGQQISRFSGITPLEEAVARLQGASIDLEELSRDLENFREDVVRDPGKLERIELRLNAINKLQQKYQAPTEEAIFQVHEDMLTKLTSHEVLKNEIGDLHHEQEQLILKMNTASAKLTKRRRAGIPGFKKEVESRLIQLKMPNARLVIDCSEEEEFNRFGKNSLTFTFTANKGSLPMPIKDVASGGELSRLSLCMKSIVAGQMDLPTLIFDEIDSGVSGEVARKMGLMLDNLAQHHQLVMVTHSPQIAAKAKKHFKVFKREEKDHTIAAVQVLKKEDRLIEIATMLSGDPPSHAAVKNAKELIET